MYLVVKTQRDIRKEKSDMHTPTTTPSQATIYSCPENGWVDCMPGPDKDNLVKCSPDAVIWYQTNCSNYEGLAY